MTKEKDDVLDVLAREFRIQWFVVRGKQCKNLDAFCDWMTDLGWLEWDRITLTIDNYQPQFSSKLRGCFDEAIIPFWEECGRHFSATFNCKGASKSRSQQK